MNKFWKRKKLKRRSTYTGTSRHRPGYVQLHTSATITEFPASNRCHGHGDKKHFQMKYIENQIQKQDTS